MVPGLHDLVHDLVICLDAVLVLYIVPDPVTQLFLLVAGQEVCAHVPGLDPEDAVYDGRIRDHPAYDGPCVQADVGSPLEELVIGVIEQADTVVVRTFRLVCPEILFLVIEICGRTVRLYEVAPVCVDADKTAIVRHDMQLMLLVLVGVISIDPFLYVAGSLFYDFLFREQAFSEAVYNGPVSSLRGSQLYPCFRVYPAKVIDLVAYQVDLGEELFMGDVLLDVPRHPVEDFRTVPDLAVIDDRPRAQVDVGEYVLQKAHILHAEL